MLPYMAYMDPMGCGKPNHRPRILRSVGIPFLVNLGRVYYCMYHIGAWAFSFPCNRCEDLSSIFLEKIRLDFSLEFQPLGLVCKTCWRISSIWSYQINPINQTHKSWLVVSNMAFIFHNIYGMSSFPLTFIFFKMVKSSHHQPERWFAHEVSNHSGHHLSSLCGDRSYTRHDRPDLHLSGNAHAHGRLPKEDFAAERTNAHRAHGRRGEVHRARTHFQCVSVEISDHLEAMRNGWERRLCVWRRVAGWVAGMIKMIVIVDHSRKFPAEHQ